MSSLLAAAIREAAEDTPAYDVLDGAIALGRRRRRRAVIGALAATLAFLGLVGVAAVALVGPGRPAAVAEPPTTPALPDRIGSPAMFTDSVAQAPPGPASVIFREDGDVVTVGAADDSYRTVDSSADPGRSALLSADGARIAYAAAGAVVVADLRTGQAHSYPPPGAATDAIAPVAWLPDGTGIVVLSTEYADDPTSQGIMKRLGILDLPGGGYLEFAAGTWPIGPAGFTVAVSPDSTRIAYQYSDFVTIFTRGSVDRVKFTLPDGRTALAGKGAWAPDGSLAVIHHDVDALPQRRWAIRFLDPATGAEPDPTLRYTVTGPTLIRLLGWNSATHDPIVVSYDAESAVDDDLSYGGGSVMPVDTVRQVSVLDLTLSGPRTLLEPAPGVTGIDVADTIVAAGAVRRGRPPAPLSPLAVGALGLAVLLALSVVAWWLWRRRVLR